MTPDTINSIKEALAPVAEKIGHGAEYGWEVLVAGQFAEGIANLLNWTLFFVGTLCVLAYTRGKEKGDMDHGPTFAGFLMVTGCFALVLTILLFPTSSFIAVISPEYAALKFLISLGS